MEEEMYNVLVEQHEAIDRLFALLAAARADFYPSRSGQPWDALVRGNAVIQAYRTRNDVGPFTISRLKQRLREIAPSEMWSGAVVPGHAMVIERHPIRDMARAFLQYVFEPRAAGGPPPSLPRNQEELLLFVWVFGVMNLGNMEKEINMLQRRISELMAATPMGNYNVKLGVMEQQPPPPIPNAAFEMLESIQNAVKAAEVLTGADPKFSQEPGEGEVNAKD